MATLTLTKSTGRRVAPWGRARLLFDRLIPRVVPGKHHTIWEVN